jgi:hypothetical protein
MTLPEAPGLRKSVTCSGNAGFVGHPSQNRIRKRGNVLALAKGM